MASIGPVTLEIFDQAPSDVVVHVSYTIFATHQDGPNEQRYQEVVQLIGDDTAVGPGEDATDDLIPGGTLWDGPVTFSTSQVAFTVIREGRLPASALDEDADGLRLRADEIRARVTLTPLPPLPASRESNLIRRGDLVIEPVA